MPNAPSRPCSKIGCPALITQGNRCEQHRRQYRRQQDEHRGSARERGYDTAWEQFRRYYFSDAAHRICHDCQDIATELHHIRKVTEHPELRLSETNIMPLCKPCHSARTARGE